jgi:hypothetical protein
VATGADIDNAGDQLGELLARTTVFARVSPEHKAQVVRAQRAAGTDVAFLGDGVNDAVALHAADVGISVDSAADVAKDAADVPGTFFFALAGIVAVYLVLVEVGEYWFYRLYRAPAAPEPRHRTPGHRVRRRAARFTVHTLYPARGHNASPGKPIGQESKVPAG